MRFTNLVTISLAALVAATPLTRRDVPTITSAISSVEKALTAFDTAVQALTADTAAASVEDLTAKSTAVEEALIAGTTAISATDAIELTDALKVQQASQALTDLTVKSIDNLIAKQKAIGENAATVVDQLTSQKKAAQGFIDAITSKVPADVQEIAATLAGQVIDALDKGIKSFSA